MKKKYYLLIIVLTCLFFSFFSSNSIKAANLNGQQINFINSIKSQAIIDYDKYNILPSITISQAILESSWGNSELTKNSNNLFGMKTNDTWNGNTVTFPTREYLKNVYTTIYANFKSYNSYSESIEDHSILLNDKRYAAVKNAPNYIEACHSLYNCGYATDPRYTEALINIIKCFNLDQYDTYAKNQKAIKESYNSYYSKEILLSNQILTLNISDNNKEPRTNFPKGEKEDTNNIPDEIASTNCTKHNYWYVIYCLLQNYYLTLK